MREKANRYIYFVSFSWTSPVTGSGFGDVKMAMPAPITTWEQVDSIRDWIEEDFRKSNGVMNSKVVILNYIFMRAE